jgi:outer membrane lipoprotein-sorting protein
VVRALVCGAALLAALAPAARAHAAPALRGEALVAAVQKARAERRSEVATVEADVVIGLASSAWAGAGTCQGRLVAVRPGSMRLLGYAAVSTVFDATTDGERFWLYMPMLERVITGAAAEESLLVALPILPGEIVSALFGEPYGAPESGLGAIDVEGTPWVAWRLADGHEVRARYSTGPTLLQRAELWAGARRVARLDYRDYRKRHGVWWPTRIDFDWPEEQGHLSLTFDQVRFGGRVDPAKFRFEPPPGVAVVAASDPEVFRGGTP